MELKWLEDFVSLAQTHSFSKSAAERNVTQSAFSRRIKQLEQWLGAPLVDRSVYPTTLTPQGMKFRETAEEAVRMLQGERARLHSTSIMPESSISIVSLHTLSTSFFPGWLKNVKAQQAGIWPRLRVENFHDCVQALVNGDVDFMLTLTHAKVPVLLDPLAYPYIALGADRLVAVTGVNAAGQPLFDAGKTSSAPLPYLGYTPESFLGRLTGLVLADCPIRPRLAQIFENPMADALKAMALLGHGIAWLPEGSIEAELASGSLVRLPGLPEPPVEIRLYRSRQKTRPIVERFWAGFGV